MSSYAPFQWRKSEYKGIIEGLVMGYAFQDAIKEIPFFQSRSVTDIIPYYNKRASSLEKVVIKAEGQQYFGKHIGEQKALKLRDFYNELSNNNDLFHYMPTLVATGKGWVFYTWINGISMDRLVWRWLFTGNRRVEKLVFFLGKWLSLFHQHNLIEWVDGKKYLLKNNLEIPIDLSETDKVPICKTYNDFTLKNILVGNLELGEFFCLDLDAAFHKDFPENMFPYHDLSILFGNLLSYSKLPIVPLNRLFYLWSKFHDGYFTSFKEMEYSPKILWLFLNYHNKGYLMDRSRIKIYSGFKNKLYRYRLLNFVKQGPKALHCFGNGAEIRSKPKWFLIL